MQLRPGTYLQGDKYRIIDILGNGGFGITYLAEHELAERKVCIKEFFPKEYYNRDDNSRSISLGSKGSAKIMDAYKAKFIKEAKTIARLKHPNIIHIHDVFEENNTAYYVMEYIEGESLSDLVKRKGALAEAEAVGYIRSVAEALGYIHERKIMHLDVKPANVMLNSEDGQVVVIDFGLSKQYDEEGHQTSSTPVGISAGFAPMEQYQQGGVKEFSPETDIYSLGATLYYLVTGQVPPQAVCVADEGLPELPAHLSSGVRNAIERSMEFQRKRRPHSAKEFLALLEDNTPEVVAIPTPKPTPSPVSTPVSVPVDDKTSVAASVPVDDKTSVAASAPVADEPTVVGAPAPKAQPMPRPKKEWAPKYAVVKPKKSEETKKKSKWWMWLLIVAVVAAVASFVLLGGGSSEKESAPKSAVATVDTLASSNDSLNLAKPEVDTLQLNDTPKEEPKPSETKPVTKPEPPTKDPKEEPKPSETKPVTKPEPPTKEDAKPEATKPVTQPNNEIWYTSSDGKVVKPYKEGKDIFGAEIESNTYKNGKGILKFKGNVTTIGYAAFRDCGNLTSVTIPNSVTTIGYSAFRYCNGLTSVTILNSVTSIGSYAFDGCRNLKSVTIPNSVKTIGDGAFAYCSSIKEFNGKFASEDRRCLIIDGELVAFAPAGIAEYTIPNSVTTIGEDAFSGCYSLKSVTIPNSVTTIGVDAFAYCSSMKEFNSKFASEDGRCLIVNGKLVAFAPAGITKFTIPDSVTTIGEGAFRYCKSLTSVTIPDSVKTIGTWAFDGCDNLSKKTKNKIKSINPNAKF